MVSFWQICKTFRRKRKYYKNRILSLSGSPQKMTKLVRSVFEITPRKPNSAKRKIARVRVKIRRGFYKREFAYLPGEHKRIGTGIGQQLNPDDIVWIRGGRTQDLPGLKYKIIHGVKRLSQYKPYSPPFSKKKRSKYGIPRVATTIKTKDFFKNWPIYH